MTEDGRITPWSVQTTVEERHVLVTVAGELDASTAGDLRDCVVIGQGDVHLDLSGVSFIDSSGLAAIIEGHLRLASVDSRLVIVERSPAVQRVFELSGVADRLNLIGP